MARKFPKQRDAGEARTIANKTSGRLPRGIGSVVGRYFSLPGSPNDTDVGPVCNDAGENALAWTFGLGNFTNGYCKDESTGREGLGPPDSSFSWELTGRRLTRSPMLTCCGAARRRKRSWWRSIPV